MVAGDLITYEKPNPDYLYQSEYYVVLHGWTDQNGVCYKVCSLGYGMPKNRKAGRLSLTILDREAKQVGRLDGDTFYEFKKEYYDKAGSTEWDNPDKVIYGAEVKPLVKVGT